MPRAKVSASSLYMKLVQSFPLRPLRSDEELGQAIEVINSLVDRDEMKADEQDYLDVLSDQVEKYEKTHHPLPVVTEAEMLRHLIGAKGITQLQVAKATGVAESTISAILGGKRSLSKAHITAFSRYFSREPIRLHPDLKPTPLARQISPALRSRR